MIKTSNKKCQFEFNWLFALIIGAVILFLAIFFASRLISTSQYQGEAELVREFDILLNPFSSVGAVGTITLAKEVSMPSAITINLSCSSDGLGKDSIRMMSKSDALTPEYAIYNKYIFGENLSGKSFYVFGMPLEMPFRIDDMIYIVSEDYCFVNPPQKIKDEISILNGSKIISVESLGQCPSDSKKVCFGNAQCDIKVTCDGNDAECEKGAVSKQGTVYFYKRSLMYAAIFSDTSLYKCNIKRLLARAESIADVYQQKGYRLATDCEMYGITTALTAFKTKAEILKSSLSPDIRTVATEADNLERADMAARCPVY